MNPVAVEIRATTAGDLGALERLYPAAFPEEDLRPIVRDLLAAPDGVVSLVALRDGGIIGHVALSLCGVGGHPGAVALLGPLAVVLDHQRQGVGRELVRAGLAEMRKCGVQRVCLLGDPAYYSRLGFRVERAVLPPYELPPGWDSAWQSVDLLDVPPGLSGTLDLPPHWRNPAYWGP